MAAKKKAFLIACAGLVAIMKRIYLIEDAEAGQGRIYMAERGGFEPPVRLLTVQRFSKPPPSATRPSLHQEGVTR
jgi:hypothetical protein